MLLWLFEYGVCKLIKGDEETDVFALLKLLKLELVVLLFVFVFDLFSIFQSDSWLFIVFEGGIAGLTFEGNEVLILFVIILCEFTECTRCFSLTNDFGSSY